MFMYIIYYVLMYNIPRISVESVTPVGNGPVLAEVVEPLGPGAVSVTEEVPEGAVSITEEALEGGAATGATSEPLGAEVWESVAASSCATTRRIAPPEEKHVI